MIRTLLKYHNLDSTLDLNDQLSEFFKRGIVMGGDVTPVASQLAVQVTPFKLIGFDGMVVIETSDTTTLSIPAGQTSVVVFRSIYEPNTDPITGFDVLELSAYNSSIDKDYLTVFATIVLGPTATQVNAGDISYDARDIVDPVGRQNIRGVLNNATLLPTQNNRGGDTYFVTSGLGDTPAIYVWNGVTWINTTDSLLVASLLQAHRSNLFSNEIHLTDEQAIAAQGTSGSPGVEQIGVTINIGTSTFTLANPLSNNDMEVADPVEFLTTGSLPTPLSPSTTYYAIPLAGPSGETFQVATSPANAISNNAITLSGAQAGTHQAVWEKNKYVTSTDPRLGTQSQTDAQVGYPSTPIPSGSNPFVTASYEIGAPNAKAITSTSGPVVLLTGDGPFYVGVGGAGTAAQYFKFYHAIKQRELIDSTSEIAITVTGVFKDVALTQPLTPSSEPTVVADFGFWTGPLYLAISSAIPGNARVVYLQKKLLNTIDRGAFGTVNPSSAETTAEILLKFFEVAGRDFDDPTPSAENNKNLLIGLKALSKYVLITTAGNLVVSSSEFSRMRNYTDYATEFALETDETVIVAGSQTYTVSNLAADVTTYDSSITSPDTPYVAVVTYAAAPAGLSGTLPGYIFTDGAGQRFRVIGYNSANNNKVLIYTGTVAVSTATGTTSGQIVAGNNPRQLELTYDHLTSFGENFIEVSGLSFSPDDYENVPPGGSQVGVGSLFTLIGTNVLPNQGSGNGIGGRLAYRVTPKIQNNRFEDRVRLYGSWEQDSTDFPGQVIGDVSRGTCGIEFTGRLNDLALYTEFRSGAPTAYRIFVNGVYNSELFASSLNESGITGAVINSTVYTDYLTDRPKMQKVALGLNLDKTKINTVRVEITGTGSIPFALSGIGVHYGSDYFEEKGRTFIGADFIDSDTTLDDLNPVVLPQEETQKVIHYIDEATLVRDTATLAQNYYSDGNYSHGNSATVTLSGITDPLFPSLVGDVWYLSSRSIAGTDTGTDTYLRVIGQGSGSRTLESAPGFSPTFADYAFRVPVAPSTGTVVVNAPLSIYDKELTRLLLTDWTTGREADVGALEDLAQDTRATVLGDGSTALRILNCTNQTANIEGYLNALQMSQTTSEIQTTAFCSRMDLVFCGNSGAANVTVTIDGAYSYTLSLSGTGVERHTIFYDGQLRSHTVKLSAPSVAGAVCVGEWILHELADPSFVGTAIAEYTQLRNANSKLFATVAPLSSGFVISNNGLRVIDMLSNNVRLYGAASTVSETDSNNPFFRNNFAMGSDGGFTFDFFGTGFELFYNATGVSTLSVTINGLAMSTANFPTAKIYTAGSSGQFTTLIGNQRSACMGLSPSFYKVVVTTVDSLIAKTFYALGLAHMAGQVMLKNLDTSIVNDLHFSQFKDLRSFLSLLPEQVGLVSSDDTGTGTGTTSDTTVQTLAPQPGYLGVVQDTFKAAASAPTSKVDSTNTKATQNFGLELYSFGLGTSSIATTASTSTVTLSASLNPPAGTTYTVQAGDVVYFITQKIWRRILTVNSQSSYVVDAPFTSTGEQIQVSQAVYTKDLVNLGDSTGVLKNRLRDIFPATSIPNVILDYKDSTFLNSDGPDVVDTAAMVCSASNNGLQTDSGLPLSTTFSTIFTRPDAPARIPQYPLAVNANEQRLFLVFFPNPAVAFTATPNLLEYTVSAYQLTGYQNSGVLNSAWGYNDGSATGSLSVALVGAAGSNTRITLPWSYQVNQDPTSVESDIELQLNGQDVWKSLAGAIATGDIAFTEETSNTLLINADIITGKPTTSVRVRRIRGSFDTSSKNAARLGFLSDIWVGTAADVTSGFANYSSLNSACAAALVGQKIKMRGNLTITENVSIPTRVMIEANGYDCFINGTVTIAGTCSYATIRSLRCTQFIIASGAVGNIISDCFWTTTESDSGTDTLVGGVQI